VEVKIASVASSPTSAAAKSLNIVWRELHLKQFRKTVLREKLRAGCGCCTKNPFEKLAFARMGLHRTGFRTSAFALFGF
jgi:hypothetical protein